jgi:hypothetical protein
LQHANFYVLFIAKDFSHARGLLLKEEPQLSNLRTFSRIGVFEKVSEHPRNWLRINVGHRILCSRPSTRMTTMSRPSS